MVLLGLALLLRVSAGVASHSIIHPDEVFQYLEQAHRVTFGYGAVPWEFRVGARSWLLPGSVAIIMRATSYFFGDAPETYLAMIHAAFSVLSLSVVLVGFLWAYRIEGRSAAILTGVLCAVWYEFVSFAFHPMPGVVAAHFLLPGVYLMYPGAPTESRWRSFAGAALVPRGTPQNRPMRDTSKPANGIGQDKVVITHGRRRRQWKTSRIYGTVSYTVRTWAEDMAPQGCDQSADPAAGMRGRRRAASAAFWR